MDTTSVLWLMLPAYCECLVLVGIHSYLGIHVLERKVIFVDLALAQIAALGTLIALLMGIPPHTPESYVFALGLTALGAAVFSLCRFRHGSIPQEAVIGLVYAIAAATAILLIDVAPHGAEHLKEILTGSILWVSWEAVGAAAGIYAVVGAFHVLARRRFLLISRDPEAAWRAGINVRLWDFLFYFTFGIVITVSVNVAGVLIVFVFLVAPAILAKLVTERLRTQLAFGWGLGVVVTAVGLRLAYAYDMPTGPAVIAAYGVATILVATVVHVLRAPRWDLALLRVALAAVGFGAAIGGLGLLGTVLGRSFEHEGPVHAHEMPEVEGADDAPTPDSVARTLARCFDPAIARRELARLRDAEERLQAVVHLLAEDGRAGSLLALVFLEEDPPLFFRMQVAEALEKRMGEPPGFAADEAFGSETNRAAAARVARRFGLPGW